MGRGLLSYFIHRFFQTALGCIKQWRTVDIHRDCWLGWHLQSSGATHLNSCYNAVQWWEKNTRWQKQTGLYKWGKMARLCFFQYKLPWGRLAIQYHSILIMFFPPCITCKVQIQIIGWDFWKLWGEIVQSEQDNIWHLKSNNFLLIFLLIQGKGQSIVTYELFHVLFFCRQKPRWEREQLTLPKVLFFPQV